VCDAAVVNGFYYDAQSGHKYATIDGTLYSSTSRGCQSGNYNLPTGWEVAPADADGIRMSTIGGWGSDCLVYSNGDSYRTPVGGSAGTSCGSGLLTTTTGPAYGVGGCSRRVLIRVSVYRCPYIVGNYNTNDCGADSSITTAAACEEAAAALGVPYSSASSWTTLPKGCFDCCPNSNFYFNTDAEGGVRGDASPVCDTGWHPPPLPPTPPASPPPAGVCNAAEVDGFYYDAQSTHMYATIDGTSYSSTTVGCTSSTASGYTSGGKYYHSLPTGWEVAPADADGIRMSTIAGWGTHILIYSDGTGYGTTLYSPGNYYSSNLLLTSGGYYSVSGCSFRVLIRVSNLNCPSPPPSPPAAFYLGEMGTNDCGSDSVVATIAGCQEAAGVLGASYGYDNSWSNNPGGGCFYIHPASNFYFNLDATGGLRDDAGNVCYGTGY
jgi:hypothetical protein